MGKIPDELRFKLERVTNTHNVPIMGYPYSTVLSLLVDQDLTEEEKDIVRKVADHLGINGVHEELEPEEK